MDPLFGLYQKLVTQNRPLREEIQQDCPELICQCGRSTRNGGHQSEGTMVSRLIHYLGLSLCFSIIYGDLDVVLGHKCGNYNL